MPTDPIDRLYAVYERVMYGEINESVVDEFSLLLEEVDKSIDRTKELDEIYALKKDLLLEILTQVLDNIEGMILIELTRFAGDNLDADLSVSSMRYLIGVLQKYSTLELQMRDLLTDMRLGTIFDGQLFDTAIQPKDFTSKSTDYFRFLIDFAESEKTDEQILSAYTGEQLVEYLEMMIESGFRLFFSTNRKFIGRACDKLSPEQQVRLVQKLRPGARWTVVPFLKEETFDEFSPEEQRNIIMVTILYNPDVDVMAVLNRIEKLGFLAKLSNEYRNNMVQVFLQFSLQWSWQKIGGPAAPEIRQFTKTFNIERDERVRVYSMLAKGSGALLEGKTFITISDCLELSAEIRDGNFLTTEDMYELLRESARHLDGSNIGNLKMLENQYSLSDKEYTQVLLEASKSKKSWKALQNGIFEGLDISGDSKIGGEIVKNMMSSLLFDKVGVVVDASHFRSERHRVDFSHSLREDIMEVNTQKEEILTPWDTEHRGLLENEGIIWLPKTIDGLMIHLTKNGKNTFLENMVLRKSALHTEACNRFFDRSYHEGVDPSLDKTKKELSIIMDSCSSMMLLSALGNHETNRNTTADIMIEVLYKRHGGIRGLVLYMQQLDIEPSLAYYLYGQLLAGLSAKKRSSDILQMFAQSEEYWQNVFLSIVDYRNSDFSKQAYTGLILGLQEIIEKEPRIGSFVYNTCIDGKERTSFATSLRMVFALQGKELTSDGLIETSGTLHHREMNILQRVAFNTELLQSDKPRDLYMFYTGDARGGGNENYEHDKQHIQNIYGYENVYDNGIISAYEKDYGDAGGRIRITLVRFDELDEKAIATQAWINVCGGEDGRQVMFIGRGHNYDTQKMMQILFLQGGLGRSNIVGLDGGCSSVKQIPLYREKGVENQIVGYNDTGKGHVTLTFLGYFVANVLRNRYDDPVFDATTSTGFIPREKVLERTFTDKNGNVINANTQYAWDAMEPPGSIIDLISLIEEQ